LGNNRIIIFQLESYEHCANRIAARDTIYVISRTNACFLSFKISRCVILLQDLYLCLGDDDGVDHSRHHELALEADESTPGARHQSRGTSLRGFAADGPAHGSRAFGTGGRRTFSTGGRRDLSTGGYLRRGTLTADAEKTVFRQKTEPWSRRRQISYN